MAIEVKLTRGSSSLNITSAPYAVGMDFAPPALNMSYSVGSGTSANKTGGGRLFDTRANDRSWSFTVRILATSATEAQIYHRRLEAFVNQQTADPLMVQFRTNADIPIPLWGQFGAPVNYECVTANVGSLEGYATGKIKGAAFWAVVVLEVKPLATGALIGVMNAGGGVYQDILGMPAGNSRGLRVCEAGTNVLTGANPISKFLGGESDVSNSLNYDRAYMWPGPTYSNYYVIATAANAYAYRAITLANTNTHTFTVYVMRPDKGTVTSADCGIYYNGNKASTYVNEGGGVWRVEWAGAGIASSQNFGIFVGNGRGLYILGCQVEEKAYHTPLTYIEALGLATYSANTRVAGWCHTPAPNTWYYSNTSVAHDDECTIQVVWRPDYISTATGNRYLLDASAYTGAIFYYNATDDKFYLTDGTNTISSAAQTFAEHDILHLTITLGPAGLNIYKNGVNIATGATYKGRAFGGDAIIYLGSDDEASHANHAGGVFMGFDIYGEEMTSAQVLALYNAAAPILAAGDPISLIPTSTGASAGDGDFQILYYSEDNTHSNNTVIHGVPGSAPARTVLYIAGADYDEKAKYLSLLDIPLDFYARARYVNFYDLDNDSAEATCSGGYCGVVSMSTSEASLSPTMVGNNSKAGRRFYCSDSTMRGLTL